MARSTWRPDDPRLDARPRDGARRLRVRRRRGRQRALSPGLRRRFRNRIATTCCSPSGWCVTASTSGCTASTSTRSSARRGRSRPRSCRATSTALRRLRHQPVAATRWRVVGGDLYDYIPISDKILGLAIADASGHGSARRPAGARHLCRACAWACRGTTRSCARCSA